MNHNSLYMNPDLPSKLDDEEILYYFKKMHIGDKKARDEIIKRNIRLVVYLVKTRFISAPYDEEELVSIGLVGLIKSVDNFNINAKNKFSTYAWKCIINTIKNYMKQNAKDINNYSLDQVIAYDEYGFEITLADITCYETFDIVSETEEYNNIKQIIELLSAKEQLIINKYFGLIDGKPMLQKEIAALLGVSRQTISQSLQNILIKCRLLLEEQKYEKYSNEKKLKLLIEKMSN